MTEHTGASRGETSADPETMLTPDETEPATAPLEEEARQAVEARPEPEDPVELASDESFPASDPPSW